MAERDETTSAGGGGPRPIDRIVRPFQIFAHDKLAGATLLIGATVIALAWANSPWSETYTRLLRTKLTVGYGGFELSKPLLLWVNDGLMGIFFFVVGLEIKREVLAGELSSPRKATLPIFGAVGGMVLPAAAFLLVLRGGPGASGWGIPMATDIAFALGLLALLGSRVPVGLKVFLTALAIVDDIGAIVVIAVFYTKGIGFGVLAIGGVLLLLSAVLNAAGLRSSVAYFILGTLVWLAFLKSGVHATLAAVLMAFTIPARTRLDGSAFYHRLEACVQTLRLKDPGHPHFLSPREQGIAQEIESTVEMATSPVQRLEHALMPVVTFLVLPVFALANAGVSFGAGLLERLTHPLTWGVVVGLFLGKQVGITAMSWIPVRLGWADLPKGVTWAQLHGASLLAGVGFTMSIFISGLAFADPELEEIAKVGILGGSLLSAVVGLVVLRVASPPAAEGG